MKTKPTTKFGRAKQRLKSVKAFYSHLIAFVLVGFMTLLFRNSILEFFSTKTSDPNFITWIDWNIFFCLTVWGSIIAVHAFWIFGHKIAYFKNWEDRKMQDFLESENSKIRKS